MSEVLVEKRGAIQWITINREERRNAMNDAVVFGIIDGLTAATSDPDIRAVVGHRSRRRRMRKTGTWCIRKAGRDGETHGLHAR